jgi:glutamate-1-semialdehyde 2,1-aminomutase
MAFHAIYEGGMFGIFFNETYPVTTFDQAANSNQKHFQMFFHHMLAKGVYFAPSPFEAGFMSIAHQQKDIDHTLSCFESLFQKLQKQS